ncbi:hypothetical protein F4820DRAFT_447275 [Hypoxylon rubiginosum]|uniref:Uncharacterized protein n=1 Tax=Hypoxylon rubiginosum TaxID=110542 RepID=A0ACB9Z3S8_9PEZI|nr:hypothetical protein F4820DRAFT_447275 [Hypoxylon rubiginosum]
MSPESSSPLFPDRPIRPLPKRRLRERLSPDVADSIQYPPAPQTATPLFGYPYSSKDDLAGLGPDPPNVAHRENPAELGQEASLRRNGLGAEQDDHALLGQARRAFVPRPIHDPPGHAIRVPLRQNQGRQANPQPPPSTTSSADGYDSFENSNNKKKRKIPTAGETILNGTHVLNDLGALGVSSGTAAGDDGSLEASGVASATYYQPGGPTTNGQGISGPGRGRYGRVRNGRSPLRVLSDPNSIWGSRSSNKLRPGTGAVQYPSHPAGENSGIISSAIASAEKLPVPQGQENRSLLHQEASIKPSPNSSAQFTFTFDPQNPVSWPGSDPAPSNMTPSNYVHQTPLSADYRGQYNGTSAGRGAQGQNGSIPPLMATRSIQPGGHGSSTADPKGAAQPSAPPKKSKRRGNSLIQAAKQRRRETEYQNFHHPPALEDVWICEFCEYERIFGRAPEALIRQYEIKDRRRRREEAERRRLLEKAKMKSRKGKKANKAPAKNNSSAPNQQSASSASQQAPPPPPHLNDHDEDQTQRQIHEEDQGENGYDSEGHDGDRSPEADVPSSIPVHVHAHGPLRVQSDAEEVVVGMRGRCVGH